MQKKKDSCTYNKGGAGLWDGYVAGVTTLEVVGGGGKRG